MVNCRHFLKRKPWKRLFQTKWPQGSLGALLEKRENASECFWCSLASPPAGSIEGMIKGLGVTFDMCQDLGMRIPLVFWSGGWLCPQSLAGPLLEPSWGWHPRTWWAACFQGIPANSAGPAQTGGHPHREPRRKPAPRPTPGEALTPGSHPPRLKGEIWNQLCSEADSQEAKTPQLQDQVLTPAPSRLIEVKLPFYTQSHKVLFHFFFP